MAVGEWVRGAVSACRAADEPQAAAVGVRPGLRPSLQGHSGPLTQVFHLLQVALSCNLQAACQSWQPRHIGSQGRAPGNWRAVTAGSGAYVAAEKPRGVSGWCRPRWGPDWCFQGTDPRVREGVTLEQEAPTMEWGNQHS